MAWLVTGSYSPACQAAGCAVHNGQPIAARFICEWDQQQGKKMVARRALYCAEHAGNFATRHNIYMADLPPIRIEDIETAGRDDWRYSDSLTTKDTKKHEDNSVCSVPSVAKESEVEYEGD